MKTMVTTSQSALIKGWQSVPLSTVVEPVKDHWKPGDTRLPYIGLEHIAEQSLTLNGIGDSDSVQSNKFRFTNGDVLFGKLRPYFRKVVQVSFDGICSTDILVLRAREGYDQKFLFYFVANPLFINRATKANTGTRMPRADWGYLQATKWLVPSLPEQKAIAAALSSLDDKIELLRRQNETLEKLAQTLFKEWFVEFNFPDKNGKPYKASGGKMMDSELGPIPEAWVVAPLGNYVRCVGGSTPSTTEPIYWNDGSVAFLTPKDMSGLSSPVILGTERYVTELGVQQISSGVLPQGTVVLSSRAPIGYLAITAVPVVINQGIIGMICDGILPFSFIFNWVKLNLDRIKANAGGSTFAEINKSSFRAIKAVIPARDVLMDYSNVTSGLLQKVVANGQHYATLSRVRDFLIPKLMNGEIRVKDA